MKQHRLCKSCKWIIAGLVSVLAVPALAGPASCSAASFRDFDFWLGRWEVHVASGQRAGANHIESAEQGCVLLEHWQGASGATGTSMSFHDPVLSEWRQVWVSPGVIIDIAGGVETGSMTLEGYITYSGTGQRFPFRGTWTPLADGRVRQFFEESREAGIWQTWFEGFYSRVPAQ